MTKTELKKIKKIDLLNALIQAIFVANQGQEEKPYTIARFLQLGKIKTVLDKEKTNGQINEERTFI